MSKIYVVTSGSYSDFGIEGVFSTEELAKEWVGDLDNRYDIREYELDDFTLAPKAGYAVWMRFEDGSVRETHFNEVTDDMFSKIILYSKNMVYKNEILGYFRGKDIQQGIKALNEMRVQIKAKYNGFPPANGDRGFVILDRNTFEIIK